MRYNMYQVLPWNRSPGPLPAQRVPSAAPRVPQPAKNRLKSMPLGRIWVPNAPPGPSPTPPTALWPSARRHPPSATSLRPLKRLLGGLPSAFRASLWALGARIARSERYSRSCRSPAGPSASPPSSAPPWRWCLGARCRAHPPASHASRGGRAL